MSVLSNSIVCSMNECDSVSEKNPLISSRNLTFSVYCIISRTKHRLRHEFHYRTFPMLRRKTYITGKQNYNAYEWSGGSVRILVVLETNNKFSKRKYENQYGRTNTIKKYMNKQMKCWNLCLSVCAVRPVYYYKRTEVCNVLVSFFY